MSAQVISFKCTLKNTIGKVLSTTINREVLNSPDAPNKILSGLAHGMQNLTKGEKRKITLSAEQAYGFYDPEKILQLPREKFGDQKNLEYGQPVALRDEKGTLSSYRVTSIQDDIVTLDGNHPLAGQDLIFEIETLDAREATPEEISDSQTVESKRTLH